MSDEEKPKDEEKEKARELEEKTAEAQGEATHGEEEEM